MKTLAQAISATARRVESDDRLAQTAITLPLIGRLAAAHAAVLENWNRKFALGLRWQRPVAARR